MIPNQIDIDNLSLRIDNPYAHGRIIEFAEGDVMLERNPIEVNKSQRDRFYTTIQDETLWNIAYQAWDNSKWWWINADVNKIDFPFELEPGTSLIIPDLELIKVSQL